MDNCNSTIRTPVEANVVELQPTALPAAITPPTKSAREIANLTTSGLKTVDDRRGAQGNQSESVDVGVFRAQGFTMHVSSSLSYAGATGGTPADHGWYSTQPMQNPKIAISEQTRNSDDKDHLNCRFHICMKTLWVQIT